MYVKKADLDIDVDKMTREESLEYMDRYKIYHFCYVPDKCKNIDLDYSFTLDNLLEKINDFLKEGNFSPEEVLVSCESGYNNVELELRATPKAKQASLEDLHKEIKSFIIFSKKEKERAKEKREKNKEQEHQLYLKLKKKYEE